MDSWVMDMFNVENKADLEFVPHPKQWLINYII